MLSQSLVSFKFDCPDADMCQLVSPKPVKMAAGPLVNRDAVLGLQAHLVPKHIEHSIASLKVPCSPGRSADFPHVR